MAIVLKGKIVEKVKAILIKYPESRDNDRFINCCIWKQEFDALNKENSVKSFLHAYNDGKLTNHDSITRARRKLQEEIPELRGKNYGKRQVKLQEKVKEEIKTFRH